MAALMTAKLVQQAHEEYERRATQFLLESGWTLLPVREGRVAGTLSAWVKRGPVNIGTSTLVEAVALQIGMDHALGRYVDPEVVDDASKAKVVLVEGEGPGGTDVCERRAV